jgi:hypothetical protein
MSVELTVISNGFSVQLTKNHLFFGQLGRLNKTSSWTFGSTDRQSSFWYVEPTKEDSMAKFKPSLTENHLFCTLSQKEDSMAEIKNLPLTKNCPFSTLCQQKKTQWPNSNFH